MLAGYGVIRLKIRKRDFEITTTKNLIQQEKLIESVILHLLLMSLSGNFLRH